jgi:hypothetical protein
MDHQQEPPWRLRSRIKPHHLNYYSGRRRKPASSRPRFLSYARTPMPLI